MSGSCEGCHLLQLPEDAPVLIHRMEFQHAGEGSIHSHFYPHVGMGASGGPFLVEYADGTRVPVTAIMIRAGDRHKIIALGPGIWLCIFANRGRGSADLRAP